MTVEELILQLAQVSEPWKARIVVLAGGLPLDVVEIVEGQRETAIITRRVPTSATDCGSVSEPPLGGRTDP